MEKESVSIELLKAIAEGLQEGIGMTTYKQNVKIFFMLRKLFRPYSDAGSEKFISELKEACADGFPIDFKPNDYEGTLLNYVVDYKRGLNKNILPAIQTLLDLGADINHKNAFENTPLQACINENGELLVKCYMVLLRNGADPNIEDADGNNALVNFIQKVNPAMDEDCEDIDAAALITEIIPAIKDINQSNNDGITAIGEACMRYKYVDDTDRPVLKRIIKALLEAGADPYKDSEWQRTQDGMDSIVERKIVKELQMYIDMCLEHRQEISRHKTSGFEYEL